MEFTIILISALYIIAMCYLAANRVKTINSQFKKFNWIEFYFLTIFYLIIYIVIGIPLCFIKGYKQMIK